MSSIRNNYQAELSQKLNYFANWLPNRPVRIGDAGVLLQKNFEPEFNLADTKPGLFKTRTSNNPYNIQYYSEGAAKIEFIGDGNLQDPAALKTDQKIKIKFEKGKSIFFEAKGAVIKRIEHFNILQNELTGLYQSGHWSLEKVIVTEIVEIEVSTIIITNKANAEVILRSENELKIADKELLSVNAVFSIEDRSSTELCMVGANRIVPLFRLSRLKKKWLGDKTAWDKSLYAKTDNDYKLEEISPGLYE